MDFVPTETRARWKALGSIAVFGCTGSAMVGGIVVDATDYSTTFCSRPRCSLRARSCSQRSSL